MESVRPSIRLNLHQIQFHFDAKCLKETIKIGTMPLHPHFMTIGDSENCPIVATMKLLGNHWNMIAIRYLHDQPMKFNQLKRAMGGISSKTLSRTTKHLLIESIVERRILDTAPISVEYCLTARGMELSEALFGMKDWGMKWLKPSATYFGAL